MKLLPNYEKLSENEFPVFIRKFDYDPNMHFHWHEKIEILCFVKGKGFANCGKEDYEICGGDILFINTDEAHIVKFFEDQDILYYCFQLDSEIFNTIIDGKLAIIQNKIRDDYCYALLSRIADAYKKKEFGFEYGIKRDIFEFFDYVLKKYMTDLIDIKGNVTYFKNLEKINEILSYINKNFSQNLSIAYLSDKFFMSSSHFSHFFKKQTGKSVLDYITNVRIDKAKILLSRTNTSVTDAAIEVGFNDINYFSRKFKQKTGVSPTEFKNGSEHIQDDEEKAYCY